MFASGEPDHGIWPLMRVKLGDLTLGDVSIRSGEAERYTFEARIDAAGMYRLAIAMINDNRDPQTDLPRRLQVDQAEVHYQRLAWDQ